MPSTSADAPPAVAVSLSFNNAMASLCDFLFSGVLVDHPDLKLAYSEGQIGWLPYVLERVDDVWEEHRAWGGVADRIPEPPSTYWHRQIYGCFFRDQHGLDCLDVIGEDQRHVRDRLPAHRLHLAPHQEGGRGADGAPPPGHGRQDRARATPSACCTSISRPDPLVLMLADIVAGAAERFAETAAFVAPDGQATTYSALRRRVLAVASGLHRAGVGAGDVVVLRLPSHSTTSSPTWPPPISVPSPPASIPGWRRPSRTPSSRSPARARARPSGRRAERSSRIRDRRRPRRAAPIPDRDVAIVFTSGTTGLPKGAVFTNRQLAAITEIDVGGRWGGGGHDAGRRRSSPTSGS